MTVEKYGSKIKSEKKIKYKQLERKDVEMLKADVFNNLLNELHKKEEEKRKIEQQKQQKIQLQMKLVEDSLSDMHNKFRQALEKGTEYPKYALIQNVLCDEVKKELIINQGFFIDESLGKTKLFYNKELFDEYRNNTKHEPIEKSTKSSTINNKDKGQEFYFLNEGPLDVLNLIKNMNLV